MDFITRCPGTNAYIDKNEKMYCITELNIYLEKMKKDYKLEIIDKTHGNKMYSCYIDIAERTLEKKDYFYTCSNKGVFQRFFTLREAREFAKRYYKIIGAIKIDKISDIGEENIEVYLKEHFKEN